jgi:FkbM family methyltransferase
MTSEKLQQIRASLTVPFHVMMDEVIEQQIAVDYIKPDACVLELGGNVGRCSCVIGRILRDGSRHVVVECDTDAIPFLRRYRNENDLKFHIEECAIASGPLYLRLDKESESRYVSSEQESDGQWRSIKTISWAAFQEKYAHVLPFDTLVVDCEGGLYYILRDEPTFLKTFSLVIIENDFVQSEHKHFCHGLMRQNGLRLIAETADHFHQVWSRNSDGPA